MDIYEFAMNMELDGKRYYEELMEDTQDKGLKRIFEMLAKDEEEHHRIIKDMKDEGKTGISSSTLTRANNIFSEMLCREEKFDISASAVEAYKHALDLEEQSMRLYEEHCEKAESKREKVIFRRLAEEEKKHKLILENILNFVDEPERTRGVKTVDSDPEFARFNSKDF
ncbi:MAG: ferritin family protein [Clostridia bacterium]|nr:ferritin family protein [Clostridia bacterium]